MEAVRGLGRLGVNHGLLVWCLEFFLPRDERFCNLLGLLVLLGRPVLSLLPFLWSGRPIRFLGFSGKSMP